MDQDRPIRNFRDSFTAEPPVVENAKPKEKDSDSVEFVEFSGSNVVCQVRLPSDMRKALQHHALKNDWSFSETVQHFIASNEPCHKAHVTVRADSMKRRPKAA